MWAACLDLFPGESEQSRPRIWSAMMGSMVRQDRGLWPSLSCPQETSGVVRAADVLYWLEYVKNTPSEHTPPTSPSTHTLTTLSHIQVGANLGLRARDSKTITWEIFFFHRRGEHLAVWMRLWLSAIVWLLGLIHCYGRLSRGPKWFALTAALFASFPHTWGDSKSKIWISGGPFNGV